MPRRSPESSSQEIDQAEDVFLFERQFSDTKIIDGIKTVDIKPKGEETKTPVVFAPGFSRTMPTFKNSLEVLHEKGRRVLSLNQPRLRGDVNLEGDTSDFHQEVLRRATSMNYPTAAELRGFWWV